MFGVLSFLALFGAATASVDTGSAGAKLGRYEVEIGCGARTTVDGYSSTTFFQSCSYPVCLCGKRFAPLRDPFTPTTCGDACLEAAAVVDVASVYVDDGFTPAAGKGTSVMAVGVSLEYTPATITPWGDGTRSVLGTCDASVTSLGVGAITYVPFNTGKNASQTSTKIARGASPAFGVMIDGDIYVNPVNGSGPVTTLQTAEQPGFCVALNVTLDAERLISIEPRGVGCSGAANDVATNVRSRESLGRNARKVLDAATAAAEEGEGITASASAEQVAAAAAVNARPVYPIVIGADSDAGASSVAAATADAPVSARRVGRRHRTPAASVEVHGVAASSSSSSSSKTAGAAADLAVEHSVVERRRARSTFASHIPVATHRHRRARSLSEFERRVASLADTANGTAVPEPECTISQLPAPHMQCEWTWCGCKGSWNATDRWNCKPDSCAIFRASAGIEGGLSFPAYGFAHAVDVLYYDGGADSAHVECGSGTTVKYEDVNATSATVDLPISPLRYTFDMSNTEYGRPDKADNSSWLPCACMRIGVESKEKGEADSSWSSEYCFTTNCGAGLDEIGWNRRAVILVGVAIAIVSLAAIFMILRQAITARTEKAMEMEVTGGYASINDDED